MAIFFMAKEGWSSEENFPPCLSSSLQSIEMNILHSNERIKSHHSYVSSPMDHNIIISVVPSKATFLKVVMLTKLWGCAPTSPSQIVSARRVFHTNGVA